MCLSVTAVVTMLQGATTIYWTVVVLQAAEGLGISGGTEDYATVKKI